MQKRQIPPSDALRRQPDCLGHGEIDRELHDAEPMVFAANLASLYELFAHDGRWFFTMEAIVDVAPARENGVVARAGPVGRLRRGDPDRPAPKRIDPGPARALAEFQISRMRNGVCGVSLRISGRATLYTGTSAAVRRSSRPTAPEPVNAIVWTRGSPW